MEGTSGKNLKTEIPDRIPKDIPDITLTFPSFGFGF
jgi:hypothetical protein